MTAALANKAIDMALQIEPLAAEGVAKDIFVRWKGADEVSPNAQLSVAGYSSPHFGKRTLNG